MEVIKIVKVKFEITKLKESFEGEVILNIQDSNIHDAITSIRDMYDVERDDVAITSMHNSELIVCWNKVF